MTVRCVTCDFSLDHCPVNAKKIVVTACFHIYCIKCLKEWITQLEKPCPLCRKDVYQKQSGKDFHVIWKIFIKILKMNPDFVFEFLQKNVGDQDTCSMCLNDLPKIPIEFDTSQNRFKHLMCDSESSSLKRITLKDIVGVVQFYSKKDMDLNKILTPHAPTIYDRIKNMFSFSS